MTDNEITAIVGWPTESEMEKYRKVAAAAEAGMQAERDNLRSEVERLTAEIRTLRSALIVTGRNLGAGLCDDVSSGFLIMIAEEAGMVTAERDRYKAALKSILAAKGLDADQLETIVDVAREALAEAARG